MSSNNRFRVIESVGANRFGETFFAKEAQIPLKQLCVGVDGQTLEEKVKYAHHLSPEEVRPILVELLSILTYVHEQKSIHCHIKPEHIILRTKDNRPLLIDLGSVNKTPQTMLQEAGESRVNSLQGFAPPEQVAGRFIDYSSDVYALGMTAIYALTGRLPRDIDSDPHTSKLLWRKDVPSIDERFAAILDKATQFNPADRYQAAETMRQNLLALESNGEQVTSSPILTSTVPSPQPPVTKVVVPETNAPIAPNPWRSKPWGIPAALALASVLLGIVGVQMNSLQANADNPNLKEALSNVASGNIESLGAPILTDDDARATLLNAQKLVGEASGLESVKDRGATEKFQAAATDLLRIPVDSSVYEQATAILADILSMEISQTTAALEELKIDSQLSPLNLTKRSLKASDWTGNKKNMFDPQAPVVTRFGNSIIQGYDRRDTWKTHQKPGGLLEGGRHFQSVWANNNDIWIEDYEVVPGHLDVTIMYGCMTQSIIQLEGYFNQNLGIEFMDKTLKAWLNDANTDDASQALRAIYASTDVQERTFGTDEFVGMVQRTDDGKIMVLVRG